MPVYQGGSNTVTRGGTTAPTTAVGRRPYQVVQPGGGYAVGRGGSAAGGGSVGVGVPQGGGTLGVASPPGLSQAWRDARGAQIAAKRASLTPDQMPGWRRDEKGGVYYYTPGLPKEAEASQAYRDWSYGLANPAWDAFGVRRLAGNAAAQMTAPTRAFPTVEHPAPGPTDTSSPGLLSVVDSPSTHPAGPPVPSSPSVGVSPTPLVGGAGLSPSPTIAPTIGPAPRPYFAFGQTMPGYGGAASPLTPMTGAGGGGAGAAGPKPASAPGFDPATAPSSVAAQQHGAGYQARQSTAERASQEAVSYGGRRPYNAKYRSW